ncbi:MAG: hypothetical protein CL920_39480 [Deltaproteobacteria bacterium]|nr:hypothetical protein [Deltaproteobacteria bacterium]MBU54817.1 hypothetical protein [Deltaproteobacteria bacterium]|tara:strand:+ start:27225 stop:28031 length:807 start_codon:yes stop_codon:yes gene_type:complete
MKKLGLGIKIMLLAFLLIVISAGSLIYLSYRTAYKDLEKQIGMRLQAIASTSALMLDGDQHEQIRGEKAAKSAAFLAMRKKLREVKKANGLDTDILTYRPVDGRTLKFVLMTNEKPFIGHTYQIKQEMKPTLSEGKPGFTKIFKDQHGEWISGYAPIRNSKGKIVGLVEVDAKLKTFQEKLSMKVRPLLVDSVVILLIGLILSFLLSRGLIGQLLYLRDVTEKISLGQMDQKIEVSTDDEVGQLAQSLERMRESLKVAMEMIAEDDDD